MREPVARSRQDGDIGLPPMSADRRRACEAIFNIIKALRPMRRDSTSSGSGIISESIRRDGTSVKHRIRQGG